MDRRKFIGSFAGNLLTIPVAAWAEPLANVVRPRGPGAQSPPLSALAPNTARKLGTYRSSAVNGEWITDYSGIVHDPIETCLLVRRGTAHRKRRISGSSTWSAWRGRPVCADAARQMVPQNCDKDKDAG
jgi:hypothetical protein